MAGGQRQSANLGVGVRLAMIRPSQSPLLESLAPQEHHSDRRRLPYSELVENALRLAGSSDDCCEVEGLARRLRVSPRTLERAFRAHRGTTVREALAMRRLRIACRLLAEFDASITSVAAQSGYCSASKMCDTFRLRLGCTPRQYRLAARRGDAVLAIEDIELRIAAPRKA